MMIMIKVKQVVVIEETMKQVMIVMIKEKYKVNNNITNYNKENNAKDYVSKSNNEQYRAKVDYINESRGRKLYK